MRFRVCRARLVCLSLLLVVSACKSQPQGTVAPGTSLLLVTFDTTRQDFISAYGADPKISPNLARFAAEGCTFVNAYSQLNVTNPAHLTIFSGLRAMDHGMFTNKSRIPKNVDTLPEAFHRAGFDTAGFPSTQHVGQDMGWRDFDHFEAADPELDAKAVTDRVLDWLGGRSKAKPFFAWVHYWDPHSTYNAPKAIQREFYQGDPFQGEERIADHPYFKRVRFGGALAKWIGDRRDPEYPRAMYAAEIHYADQQLGRIFAYLDEEGLRDSTAVVVIADHGESLSEHGIFFGHSGLYETQIRIPFLARIPGFPAGLRPKALVSQLDVAPTIVQLFGITLQNDLRGLSLVPVLLGRDDETVSRRDSLIHEHSANLQVVHRRGKWKLMLPVVPNREHLPNVPQLFDVEADRAEIVNVADSHADVVQELAAPLEPWIRKGLARVRKHDRIRDAKALERLKALGYVQ